MQKTASRQREPSSKDGNAERESMVLWTHLLPRIDVKVERRPPSPVSTKPDNSFQTLSMSLFPPTPPAQTDIRVHDLPDYVTKFNAANLDTPCRLQIYLRTGDSTGLRNPVLLRFVIQDVAIFYITLASGKAEDDLGKGDTLVAENVTSFGPREQVCFAN
jgi:hypothetical protein